MTLLDLCSYLGLGAVAAVTVNLFLGLLISLRYSPVRLWPKRPIDLFALHRWTAYAALALAVVHPAVLLLLRSPRFSLGQILWPIHSPLQPKLNSAGAAALYLLLMVLLSSVWRLRLGRSLWRNLHWLVYPAAALMLLHSLLTDPELRDGHPDLLDGGKIFIEGTGLLMLTVITFRVLRRKEGFRPGFSRVDSVPNTVKDS